MNEYSAFRSIFEMHISLRNDTFETFAGFNLWCCSFCLCFMV